MGANKHLQPRKKGKPFKNNKKKPQVKPLNRKHKLHIKFDASDRKDYLKGFQKRKQERREQAQRKIEEDLKKEMKKIRSERREMMKKMIYEGYDEAQGDAEEEIEDSNKIVTTIGTATVEISEMNLTSALHPEKVNMSDEESDEPRKKSKENGDTNDDIPVYTKDKLEDLGIFTKKDLQRSWKQSAARTVKANKLMQKREMRHARDQRKGQRKSYNKKKRNKLKKSKNNKSNSRRKK